ncbi:MAG TPA: hypothetical protein VGJ84_07625 [Polyangiaceae bacterium]
MSRQILPTPNSVVKRNNGSPDAARELPTGIHLRRHRHEPPPHDIDAELDMLSAVLSGQITAAETHLSPEVFYDPAHARLWALALDWGPDLPETVAMVTERGAVTPLERALTELTVCQPYRLRSALLGAAGRLREAHAKRVLILALELEAAKLRAGLCSAVETRRVLERLSRP